MNTTSDLLVIPKGYEIPVDVEVDCDVHEMGYLHMPSIVRTGPSEGLMSSILDKLRGAYPSPPPAPPPNVVIHKLEVEADKELPRFFRYMRPRDEKNAYSFGPKGGVTFYIELDAANKTFAFSYSLCHPDDLFNFNEARTRAVERFNTEQWFEVKNYDCFLGIMDNIWFAIDRYLHEHKVKYPEGENPSFSSVSETVSRADLKTILKYLDNETWSK